MRPRLQIGSKTRFREDVIAEDRLSELVLLFFRGEIEKKRKPFGSFSEAFRKGSFSIHFVLREGAFAIAENLLFFL